MSGSTYQDHPEMAPPAPSAFDAGYVAGRAAETAAKTAVVAGEVVVGAPIVVGEAVVGTAAAAAEGLFHGIGSFVAGIGKGSEDAQRG